jgi:DNA-binding transcriptional MerR regulator
MHPTLVLGRLPDRIASWQGTAAALADEINGLLPEVGLADDVGCANERLVRHYVQVGILSPPQKAGREALFDKIHIAQFLAARYLLNDGWSLAKISELFRAYGGDGPVSLATELPAPTAAEETLQRLRNELSASRRSPDRTQYSMAPPSSQSRTTVNDELRPLYSPLPQALQQAAEITQRRRRLEENLTELGNPEGKPVRQRTLRIELAPWCHVYVDTDMLKKMPPDAIDTLGSALTHALHEERMTRGDKS